VTQKALSDLRVIDLTQMLAGPFCTQILADQGAHVIKVETRNGDGTRSMGPFMPDDQVRDFGGYFQSVNRNKSSIVIDLKTETGKSVLKRLIEQSDVVVENFRSGVMDRLGLSYETLSKTNPTLVYGAIRGFGDRRSGASPYTEWPAYDVVAQAMGGVMGITGPNAQTPTKVGPGVGDTVPAMMLTIGILAAVHHARRTGEGQFVDVAMADCVLALCERIVYQHSYTNASPVPEGNRHPLLSPFGLFRASDGWVSIACAHDEFWRKLARAIGRSDLAEHPDFSTNAARVRNDVDVSAAIEAYTRGKTKSEIAAVLGGNVPFGPVYTASDIFEDEHFTIRDMLVELEQPNSKQRARVAGVPIKMSLTQGSVSRRAPLLGEQTDEILAAAGYDADAVRDMRQSGAVA
jgi:crotonobetainyl-CoA:carnitine CoA-transferase CaiB-like acyl-CoA transferase